MNGLLDLPTDILLRLCKLSLIQLSSPLEKVLLSCRWKKKFYSEQIFLKSRKKYRPWLWLEKGQVFVAQGRHVHRFERTEEGVHHVPSACYSAHMDDVTRIVIKDDSVITSANDGSLICWDKCSGRELFSHTVPVEWNECMFMDWSGHTVALGHNRAAQVQFYSIDAGKLVLQKQFRATERIWTVALSEDSKSCAIATAGYMASPLALYDLQRDAYKLRFSDKCKVGAGVYAAQWESPHLLLTGSFDTYLRLWDTRTAQVVRKWEDPYDTAIYSLCSDGAYTILAGTARHGRVALYDTRHSNCIQMYYMKDEGGPVYSVQFDPVHMFVALESSVHVLNFAYQNR